MKKFSNLFKKLSLPLALLFTLSIGGVLVNYSTGSRESFLSSAQFATQSELKNDLPAYFKINSSISNGIEVSNVCDIVYLFQNGSYNNITIADNEILGQMVEVNGENIQQTNYYYSPNMTNNQIYYYFDFTSALSLYYDMTSTDIQEGKVGENLLLNQNINNYVHAHENSFTPSNTSLTPKQLSIQFQLNTINENIEFGKDEQKNNIVLNKEGIYTLVIPVIEYYTNNGGITFTSTTRDIYYNFMIFNANTYFDTVTGKPRISSSDNIQETLLTSSSDFSTYYFYNFAYSREDSTLPTIMFDPTRFSLSIEYTDVDQNTHNAKFEFQNGKLVGLNENGEEISKENEFIRSYLSENNGNKQATLVFSDIGSYDIEFSYLYTIERDNESTIYNLDLESLSSNSIFKNKAQRIYIYGYQTMYSDYSNINPITNQPKSKDLKTYNDTNGYLNSADITSKVNNYAWKIGNSSIGGLENANPTSLIGYNPENLKSLALEAIKEQNIQPAKTNQTPIKFINNARNDANYSKFYSLTQSGETLIADNGTSFQGFNQNTAGTYLYVIQYKFDSFMSESGTLQSALYHYQIFYFTVTNSSPTVDVLDSNYNEIYTNGFTNKNVFILNDAENNIYDAEVNITLSAQNYNNGSYFFKDVNIKELSNYGFNYQKFLPTTGESENDNKFNEKLGNKNGILIETTNAYANAKFTIKIVSANSSKPSTRTFTIDTNDIKNITAKNVSLLSSTTYQIGNAFSSYNTNQPMVLTWDEKASGAMTYGYVAYIPTQEINYYSSQSDDNLTDLINRLISNDVLPVSYKVDLGSRKQWTEYSNAQSFTTTIPSTYVKTNDGFYILEVYDQAGNSDFGIFFIDTTSPMFIQEIIGDRTSRSIFSNSESISVPETGVDINIRWTSRKAIYLDNLTSILDTTSYQYGSDVATADQKLKDKLSDFFKTVNNSNLLRIDDIRVETKNDASGSSVSTGISSYNGYYLSIPINETVYIKEGTSSTFEKFPKPTNPNEKFIYSIKFYDDNGNLIADNTTFKILIRDSSNTYFADNESLLYRNFPSGYVSFNVTADASKMMIKDASNNALDFANYNLTGKLYNYLDENNENQYTHLPGNGEVDYTQTDLQYKFSYYTPTNSKQELKLHYIPVAESGAEIKSIVLYYYPYERKLAKFDGNSNYYYYYGLKETDPQRINIFSSSEKVYETGKEETFDLVLGSDPFPLAGKYVIERIYKDNSKTDQNDFYKRTLTIIIDNKNLVSPLESVTATDENGDPILDENGKAISSLESLVGGDILLSFYSGSNNSTIEIAFPKYNNAGLNSGSFYTKDSFNENDNIASFAVRGNKLPISLYIPKYKYTIASTSSTDSSNGKSYNLTKNDELSYYGNAKYQFNTTTRMYDVYIEGVLVESFGREQQAIDYLDSRTAINEYQIFVEVKATIIENNREEVKYYYSDGTDTNGYLTLYLASGKNGNIDKSSPLNYFYQKGNYVVTIYQASNIGSTSSFYSLYKFGFEIISQTPDFEVIGDDGYSLNATNTPNTHYTNSKSLKVQWEIPTSEYEAKIDEDSISIRAYPSSATFTKSEIISNGNSRSFTIDTERLVNTNDSYIEITMQYEGFNREYYSSITKRIYFDKSMPSQNLQNLMALTENATQNAFTTNYQIMQMRQYFDYKNDEIAITNPNNISNASYSYSVDSGNFKYYSYNVTSDFFNNTLASTVAQANNNPKDTQFVYYKRIENINSYIQVDKTSFSAGNYFYITSESVELHCGFYEIVEMDYAGNMVVYIVQLSSSNIENDPNYHTDALTYGNSILNDDVVIENSQIENGFNIYSNSGFEIKNLNYKSDAWNYFTIRRAGESEIRYMKSPWLDESQVYQLIFSSSGVQFNQVSLSSLFDEVESSSNKHRLLLADRTLGENQQIYISVMDASLSTQKVEDPTQTSAILNISVPTPAQVSSTTTSYIYPSKITISQFDNTIISENKWRTIMVADQLTYGTWTPTDDFTSATSFISFRTLPGNTTLQVTINLGINASQKVKFDIVDNFGNTTTVIQLANEVSYREISGPNAVYELPESDGTVTYLSSNLVNYSYNILLYSVKVYNRNNIDITSEIDTSIVTSTNIMTYALKPSRSDFYDDLYKLVIRDVESDNEIKTIQVRIYNKLPFRTSSPNDVSNGGIIFNDKYQKPIEENNIGLVPGTSVNFNGTIYTATSENITTFSNSVTLRFYNGQNLAYDGNYNYQKGYTFSVYLSKDNGNTWENINSVNSDTNGYTISGVGDYTVLIKYDNSEIFTELCKIFNISILDTRASYYYITVDGLNVEKSDVKYTSLANHTYEINYIVSVDYVDKDNRLRITTNEELNVNLELIKIDSTGSNVTVEIYMYACGESTGEFTIIYIAETNNIISTFTYETSTGTTSSIKDVSSAVIVANKDTETTFNRLKINFSAYYGITANKVNIDVEKLFNNDYVKVNCPVYLDGTDSYIYINNPGTYRIRVYDSCSPANVQLFNNSRYIDVIFLSSVPFIVTSTNETGENVITEPIQKAVYNGRVIITPTNLSTYYRDSNRPAISVKRNGYNYSGYTSANNSYTFTEAGYYTIKFSAVSRTGIPVREEEYSFTIINKNESRYAFEFAEYDKYYIKKVEKDGIDITDALTLIGNYPTIKIDDKIYLAGLTINYLDEKTGGGRYKVTICPNNQEMINTLGEEFSFEFWINMALPPISVSLAEGDKTTKDITISFNVQNLYNAVGDCYLVIGDVRRDYTAENISSYGTNETIRIVLSGTYYIQIYTSSGHLLYSYKVVRTEPLNAFAIIAIVISVLAAGAIIGITIALRKRQKVK